METTIALFLILVFHSSFQESLSIEFQVCNPVKCFSLLNKIFLPESQKDSCMKITEIEDCVHACYFDDGGVQNKIFQGLRNVKFKICSSEEGHQMLSECVDKHKYLLLFCVHESFNLNALDVKADQNLLMCRKVTEAQRCNQGTLVPCSPPENDVAQALLEELFRLIHLESCTHEAKDVHRLNITYPVISNDYKNLAMCFDANREVLNNCVPKEVLTSSSVTYSFFSNKLCKNVETFLDCISDIVQDLCYKQKHLYDSISESLFEYVLPKCFPFKKLSRPSDTDSSDVKSDIIMANQQVTSAGNSLSTSLTLILSFESISFIISITSWFIFFQSSLKL